jgi:outer membrane receptor protein involved in Fe transport
MFARRFLVCPLFLLISFVMLSSPSDAQTVTGSLQGTVVDTSGGVLPGVTVTIRNEETGSERVVVTNETGFYSAPFLAIGRYTIKAELQGFAPASRSAVDVPLNQTTVANFKLDPRLTEQVTVTGAAASINTTNQEIKNSLNEQQVIDKPSLNPGSFLDLAALFPGFQENPTTGQNNPTASSGSSINFNGTGTRGATFQINGVNNDDSSENQNRQGVALSTIKEFQVISNSYSAEFGRGYGAVVLVQTKSGTNALHGDVYTFAQDNAWNARSFFAQTKPDNSRDEYGFTAGFPVRRDHLFGYASADRTKSKGTNTYVRDLFLASELAAPRLTRGNDTPENRAFIESVLKRFPASLTPNDSRSARTYSGLAPFDFPDEDYSGRLDWTRSASQTLTGRYQFTHQRRNPTDIIVGEQALQNNRQSNLGITWTHVLSGNTVGELRYGLGIRKTHVDIEAGNDTPIIRFGGTPVSGSIIGNAGNFPIHRDQNDHQFVYNLRSEHGRHSLKTGTDIRRSSLDDLADSNSRGSWSFTTSCGGTTYATSYAAFLDGCVNSFTKGYGPFFLENRMNEYNVYGEDDWRLRQNLTVNLGLRYEYVGAPYEKQKRIDYGFNADKNNIEPRVGFAFSPKADGGWVARLTGGADRSSIRGGFGIYDGRIFQSIFSQTGASLRFNPPNAVSKTFSTLPNILNVSDPSLGFTFVPGQPTGRISVTVADPNLEMPSTKQFNLTFERQIAWQSAMRVTYTGTRTNKLLRYKQDNLPVSPLAGGIVVANDPNNAPAAGFPDLRGKKIDKIAADVLCAGTGFIPGVNVTTQCPVPVLIADNEISFRVPRTNERRPDPRYTTNLLVSNDSQAWYDGLQLEWDKRFSHGVQFLAAYTRSRSLDTTSEATFVGTGDTNQTGPNKQYAKGHSRFDTPHRFSFNGSWRMPFFAGRNDVVGLALGGWQLAAVLRLASGTPFSVVDTSGRDLDFNGFTEARPVILDRSILNRSIDNPATSQQLLPRSAFRSVDFTDTFADIVPRNSFFLDGTHNVDLGLYKNFPLPWHGQWLSFRLEGYNVFNKVQFGFPSNDIASSSFGRLISGATAYRPRTIQLAFRYTY